MQQKKHLRTRKLIDKSLQLRLVGAFVAVGCVATLFQVVLLNQSMLSLSQSMPSNGDLLLAETPGVLARSVLITLGVLIPAMTLVGILVTHRIAGPAYRMRMYCNEIAASGEVTYKCRIRQHDELQSMCEVLNEAVSAVQRAAGTPSQTPSNPSAKDVETAPSLVADQRSQPADAEAK
ncbi:MAG: hypothetical protein R3F33_16870 [Planctomycetota bacterium]